ncbi:MAG: MFS family permease [Cellvibrionaceae bacterium]|jgi:MFS family permease
MLPSETRSVAALVALYTVRMLGLFMVLPVLSLSGDEYRGSSIFLLGLALGVYGLTQALLQIPFGILSDRYGRKPLIAIGLLIFAAGSWVAATADTVEMLIIGRALQGAGAIAGVVMAMVADLTSDANRTKAMASIGASIGLTFALSLFIGPMLMSFGGIRWIFWVTLCLSLVGLIILFWLIPAVPVDQSKRSLAWRDLQSILTDVHLSRLNIGIFVLHAVLMASFVAFPLMLEDAAIPQKHHAWVYLGAMVLAFLIMLPLIIIGERHRQLKRIFLSVLLLTVISLLALAFANFDAWSIIGAMMMFFVGFNYLEATLPSLMSKTVAADKRGAGSGIFSTSQFLGAACGGLLGGWLYEFAGRSTVMLVCAIAMVLWWLIALGMVVPQRSKIARENVVA